MTDDAAADLRARAEQLDMDDPLASLRDEFIFPETDGAEEIYLVGNSLGLLSHGARASVQAELDSWANMGVRGHFDPPARWSRHQDALCEAFEPIVGAAASEIAVMNSLTVNLHLLMVSFYDPTPARHKILIDDHAFPSDHYAVESQIRQRGFDPETSLITVGPRPGSDLIEHDDIVAAIAEHGESLALVMFPGVQYYTGQVFDMAAIIEAGHRAGALVGLDLAHAVGNVPLRLHDWNADFAAWCTYKYLNGGPGSIAGAFVHARHHDTDRPRFHGWWGANPDTRFEMSTTFDPAEGADAWQISCGTILSEATIGPQLELVARAGGVEGLRTKAELLVGLMDDLLDTRFDGRIRQLNPRTMAERGCQFALEVTAPGVDGRAVFEALEAAGVACDWRYPNVIRVAPVPLYTRFVDLVDFADILDRLLTEQTDGA